MAWDDTQTTTDTITHTEWNNMVTYIKGLDSANMPDYVIYKSGSTIYGVKTLDRSTVSSGTDASTVIQAVIDAAETSGLRWIHLKNGTYSIGTTFNINDHLRFTGDGQEQSEFYLANGVNADMIQINSALTAATHYRVSFTDLKFDGNYSNQTAGSIIVGYGIIQSHFTRCHWENPYDYAVELRPCEGDTSGAYGHHNQFIDCLIDQGDQSSGEGAGIYMRNNDENSIIGCQFQYLKIGVHDEIGFNSIMSCSFVNGTAGGSNKGVYIEDCSRTRVVNNVFDLLTGHGIHLKGAFNVIEANSFYNCGAGTSNTYDGIYIEWYGSNIISNNSFLNSSGYMRYGINEAGNAAEDTYGKNLLMGNMFYSISGATTLTTSTWGTAALNETNTNTKSKNYSVTSSGLGSEL